MTYSVNRHRDTDSQRHRHADAQTLRQNTDTSTYIIVDGRTDRHTHRHADAQIHRHRRTYSQKRRCPDM